MFTARFAGIVNTTPAGTITGSGANNQVTLWNGATGVIGDAGFGWTGSGGTFDATLGRSVQLGAVSTTTGLLKLANAGSAFLTTIQAGAAAAARTYTWPTNFGAAGSILTDAAGNGTLSWGADGVFGTGVNGQVTLWTGTHSIAGDVGLTFSGTGATFLLETQGSITLPATVDATTGIIFKGANSFIHNFDMGVGNNTFVGVLAGNFTGFASGYNSGFGVNALSSLISGTSDNAFGVGALGLTTGGDYNNAFGYNALAVNTTGSRNVALGHQALLSSTTGDANVALGYAAGSNAAGSNELYLGNVSQVSLADDKAYSLLYGTFAGSAGTSVGQMLQVNGTLNTPIIGNGVTAPVTTLTESVATGFATLTFGASESVSTNFLCRVKANDATNFQSLTCRFNVSSVRKAAGNTITTIGTVDSVLSESSGGSTLTCTFTVTEGASAVTINANAVSSLTQTTLNISFLAESVGAVTIAKL